MHYYYCYTYYILCMLYVCIILRLVYNLLVYNLAYIFRMYQIRAFNGIKFFFSFWNGILGGTVRVILSFFKFTLLSSSVIDEIMLYSQFH